jgi:hypothetical protein
LSDIAEGGKKAEDRNPKANIERPTVNIQRRTASSIGSCQFLRSKLEVGSWKFNVRLWVLPLAVGFQPGMRGSA